MSRKIGEEDPADFLARSLLGFVGTVHSGEHLQVAIESLLKLTRHQG